MVQFLARPWDHGKEFGQNLADVLSGYEQKLRDGERRIAKCSRGERLDEAAAIGGREAFQYVKAADVQGQPYAGSDLGTAAVLEEHRVLWGGLWRDGEETGAGDAGWLSCLPPDVPCRRIAAEQLRASAAAFAADTSCSDGAPAKGFGNLSLQMLEALADLGLLWEAAGRWPSRESVAMTVMIPKGTSSGERPITLFRSAIRVMARAKARAAAQWLDEHSPPHLNAARGRRVGDAMWRTQLRALLSESRGLQSAEVQLDLHKAFELVDRGKLIEAAAAAGYPCDVLACGLSMYGWARRIVFRGCVTRTMRPVRGIAAGSAFATTELWVLLCDAIGRLTRRFPRVQWCLHVDDLSGPARA